MERLQTVLIFFPYGLAFFAMGLAVALETGRAPDPLLRRALPALAAFGLLHGFHEWLEMFVRLQGVPATAEPARIGLLAVSFLLLACCGSTLLVHGGRARFVIPCGMFLAWCAFLIACRKSFARPYPFWDVADAGARYIVAIPASLLTAAGLIARRRLFCPANLEPYRRDSCYAAWILAAYGLIGQPFPRPGPLWPATFLNEASFQQAVGVPVQLVRALAAALLALFVLRFLRSFELTARREIARAQSARLEEAQRRDTQRQDLLRRVVAVQEIERQRIARELHDEIGQSLTAIGLGIRAAASSLPRGSRQTEELLDHLGQMVTRAIVELQRLVADLRPSQLDDLGLPAALRSLARQIAARTGIRAQLVVEGAPGVIDARTSLALFRIVQEALTNAVKHSAATEAIVRLTHADGCLRVTIEDNGRGFDPDAQLDAGSRRGWGLIGMQERAALLGGQFAVQSRPGAGTRVEITLPCAQDSGERDANTPALGR